MAWRVAASSSTSRIGCDLAGDGHERPPVGRGPGSAPPWGATLGTVDIDRETAELAVPGGHASAHRLDEAQDDREADPCPAP